jgi:hypothetical protein
MCTSWICKWNWNWKCHARVFKAYFALGSLLLNSPQIIIITLSLKTALSWKIFLEFLPHANKMSLSVMKSLCGNGHKSMVKPYGNELYIITTVKHAIWLVNSRAGSGYPARGIKIPPRDFLGILKMSLFHCSYFIKQLPNGFPSGIAWYMHLGCCSTFGKRKTTLACGSSILRFPKVSRHPSCMDHAILHEKPFAIRYSFSATKQH